MRLILCLLCWCFVTASNATWNMPYPESDSNKNYLYSAFAEQPKHLDPARSYSSDEYAFIGQIYEPPFQYHYLKRPFQLIPLTASKMPTVQYFSKDNIPLSSKADVKNIAYSVYTIQIKPGILFQPHPAFSKDKNGKFLYHNLKHDDVDNVYRVNDFAKLSTRELTAADYVYQIKRLAHPELNSPILSLMNEQIVGFKTFAKQIKKYPNLLPVLDISGVKEVDQYTYQIKIIGKDPQFVYWLAMPFFAPMPWEAIEFYNQDVLKEKNITLDWFPVGTGPYLLEANNPNRHMILTKNPNFRGEAYPSEGMPEDSTNGLLVNAGQTMPFVDKVIYSLEKESIPRWTKFIQGYYDNSGISSDNFDQAVTLSGTGSLYLNKTLQDRNIQLQTSIAASSYYWGFNMLDEQVGGSSIENRKLRQAISIALDMEEYITIFMNGRGISAQGPIPPGLFGFDESEESFNPVVYDKPGKRKSISYAKQLLEQAGYPNGIDSKTGRSLILNYDVIASGGPDDKARLNWMIKQFKKLNITLNIRGTQYNRFREKMKNGNAQIFSWGWNADYPDPENFMFLLYSGSSKVKHGGENAANYSNPKFDAYYQAMKDMDNTPERLEIINNMLKIAQIDSPWIWGVHPKVYSLSHSWNSVVKPNEMANNTLKYLKVNASLRAVKRAEWNQPVLWPIGIFCLILSLLIIPIVISYWIRERWSKKQWLEDVK